MTAVPGARSLEPGRLAILYVALLGTLQLVFLWTYRTRFGSLIPVVGATVLLILLGLMIKRASAWALKSALLGALIALTTFGPGVIGMVQRLHAGLTFEVDGLAMDELAIDRVMHGHGIYGVDWSGTVMEGYAHFWGGVDLHYYPHFPLMVVSAIPVRLVADAAHLSFDYRMVIFVFSLIGLAAIAWLPIPATARFVVAAAIFLNPALSLASWTGHDDIRYLAFLMLGLTLLARRHWWWAVLAFGIAMALKPFAVLCLPLLLVLIWRNAGEPLRQRAFKAMTTCFLFGAPMVLSVAPFFLANPRGLYRDLFVYPTTLIHASGYGLGGILVALHVVQADQPFSLGPAVLVVLIPTLWFVVRLLSQNPNLGQFLASYSIALFALLITSRYFADNYGAALVALLLCLPVLYAVPLKGPGEMAAPASGYTSETAASAA